MDRPKIKKLSEKFAFFSNFLNIFINFNAYFWKITPNFRALPNSKISFHPRKIGPPQTFSGLSSTEKSCINYCSAVIKWSQQDREFPLWVPKTAKIILAENLVIPQKGYPFNECKFWSAVASNINLPHNSNLNHNFWFIF